MWRHPVPDFGNLPLIGLHSSTSSQTIQEAQGEADFAKSQPYLWREWMGWGDIPVDMESKAARWERVQLSPG